MVGLARRLARPTLRIFPRHPQHIRFTQIIGRAGHDEEQIREPIQIDQRLLVDGFGADETDDGSFSSPADGAGEGQSSRRRTATRQHETLQWRQWLEEPVNGALEALDLGRGDAQNFPRLFVLGRRHAQVGAHVEQVVLDRAH